MCLPNNQHRLGPGPGRHRPQGYGKFRCVGPPQCYPWILQGNRHPQDHRFTALLRQILISLVIVVAAGAVGGAIFSYTFVRDRSAELDRVLDLPELPQAPPQVLPPVPEHTRSGKPQPHMRLTLPSKTILLL